MAFDKRAAKITGGIVLILVVLVGIVSAVESWSESRKAAKEAELRAAVRKKYQETAEIAKQQLIQNKAANIAKALAMDKPAEGHALLKPYEAMEDPDIIDARKRLDDKERILRIDTARRFLKDGALDQAANELAPYMFKSADADVQALLEKIGKERKRYADAEKKFELAERKKQGVQIGMSAQEVMQSNWGRPQKINRTVTARGTREQWVYGGGYLYFENGILTTIQN